MQGEHRAAHRGPECLGEPCRRAAGTSATRHGGCRGDRLHGVQRPRRRRHRGELQRQRRAPGAATVGRLTVARVDVDHASAILGHLPQDLWPSASPAEIPQLAVANPPRPRRNVRKLCGLRSEFPCCRTCLQECESQSHYQQGGPRHVEDVEDHAAVARPGGVAAAADFVSAPDRPRPGITAGSARGERNSGRSSGYHAEDW